MESQWGESLFEILLDFWYDGVHDWPEGGDINAWLEVGHVLKEFKFQVLAGYCCGDLLLEHVVCFEAQIVRLE